MMTVKIKWDNASKALSALPSKSIIKPDMFTKSKQKNYVPAFIEVTVWWVEDIT